MAYNPQLLASLIPQLQAPGKPLRSVPAEQGNRQPQGMTYSSQRTPETQALLGMLVRGGLMPAHYDTRGRLLGPGQVQGGRGLDGSTFEGLDDLHAMQQGRSDRYSTPTFFTPNMGPSRVGQAQMMQTPVQPTSDFGPNPLLPAPKLGHQQTTGLAPTPQETASMQGIRQQVAGGARFGASPQGQPQAGPLLPPPDPPRGQLDARQQALASPALAAYSGIQQNRQQQVGRDTKFALQQLLQQGVMQPMRDFPQDQRRQQASQAEQQRIGAGLSQIGTGLMGQVQNVWDKTGVQQALQRSEETRFRDDANRRRQEIAQGGLFYRAGKKLAPKVRKPSEPYPSPLDWPFIKRYTGRGPGVKTVPRNP